MQGLTGRERELAIAAQGPGTGICLALAELELWWENHRKGAPDVHELRMNVRADGLAGVQAVADWLGVEVETRHGCHMAHRRFGAGADSVIIEAHFTPSPAAAHFERLAAREAAQARPELAAAI